MGGEGEKIEFDHVQHVKTYIAGGHVVFMKNRLTIIKFVRFIKTRQVQARFRVNSILYTKNAQKHLACKMAIMSQPP